MTQPSRDQELLAVNQAMLDSVIQGDWDTYARYCSNDLSCFEPETNGVLAEGLPFHRFYFDDDVPESPNKSTQDKSPQITMARPHLRWLSPNTAILSYTRLTQRFCNGVATTTSCCETRVWEQQQSTWKQLHVHRS
jgi:calcium/calmodulin-dependent protein kinase (CaM kinase) II